MTDKLTIKLDEKLQRKLTAIAKHLKTLGDELEVIDNEVCEVCGHPSDITLHTSGVVVARYCTNDYNAKRYGVKKDVESR